MSGFLQKLRVVALGQAHDLLDKAIDMDSPSALRQYTRDLEEALDKMTLEAANQGGLVRTLTREKQDLETRITSLRATITKQIADGKTEAARANGALVLQLTQQLQSKSTELENQKQTSAKLDQNVQQLQAKHQLIVSRVNDLARLDRNTKMKEQSAAAMNAAAKLVNAGADISIDDIQQRMQSRNDVASEKFDRAMGGIQSHDETDQSQLDALMNELAPQPVEKK